ncbi:hypothetical protein VV867_09265 [Pseudomonas sp. JH-2]|uniref:hypothetical protein n=1 Tax=Pseudomonas sp. JH-2 TaxID=3114998 RepID=UPI002E254D8A|nr:hypothetical protein [Pseudomonas sp. JH-2]
MKKSLARNHHFISQAEQRLNAIDSSVRPENQRIYRFDILQREPPSIRKSGSTGVKIEKNLSRQDLYTLKILDEGGQHNLESAFQQYENDIPGMTRSLLNKLKDPKSIDFKKELLRLYALKLLNIIRNPYDMKRTLEMFRELRGVLPGNKDLQSHFISLDSASRPQVAQICEELSVSEEEYIEWLKIIYLLILQPLDQGLNLIEHLIKSVIDNDNIIKDFSIFRYDEPQSAGVLLCDRIIDERPKKGTQVQMFNLDASAFMVVMLVDIKGQDIIDLNPEYRDVDFKQGNVVRVNCEANNLTVLKTYNQHCVWLAHSNVYCAHETPYGVHIETQTSERPSTNPGG